MDMLLKLGEIHEYFKVSGPADDGSCYLKFTFTDALGKPQRVDSIGIPIVGPRATVADNRKLAAEVKKRGERTGGIWVAEGDRTPWLKPKPSGAAAGEFDPLTPGVIPPVKGEPGIPSDGMGRPTAPPTKKR